MIIFMKFLALYGIKVVILHSEINKTGTMTKRLNLKLNMVVCMAIACIAMLLCTSCKKEPSIVGKWQVVNIYDNHDIRTTESHGATGVYEFRENGGLSISMTIDGETSVDDNNQWMMRGDTLYMYEVRQPDEEPGMPGVMLVEKLTQSEMRWLYLITGDLYIDLKRID